MNHKHEILGSDAALAPVSRQTSPKTLAGAYAPRCRAPAAVALLLLCLAASGCGQKGPLYLPSPAASAPTSSSTVSR